MNDMVFGIKLTADGKQLVAEVGASADAINRLNGAVKINQVDAAKMNAEAGRSSDALRQASTSTDALAQSQQRSAAEVQRVTDALARNAASVQAYKDRMRESASVNAQTSSSVTKLLDRYDQQGAKLRQLKGDFEALNRAARSGNVAMRDDGRLDMVYAKMKKEIDATTGSVENFSGKAVKGMNKTRHASAGMKRELMVIGHEVLTGDISRLPGSFMVLAESFPKLITPLNIGIVGLGAAVFGLGYALKSSVHDIELMNNALVLNNEYAGMSSQGMDMLAFSMTNSGKITIGTSREIVTAMVSSGRIGVNAIGKIADLSASYAAATGADISKIAPDLIRLFADPLKGAEELNKRMHYLTVADLDYIESLTRVGNVQDAQIFSAEKFNVQLKKQKIHVSGLALAWRDFTNDFAKIADAALGAPHQTKINRSQSENDAAAAKQKADQEALWVREQLKQTDSYKIKQLQADMDRLNAQKQTVQVKERELQLTKQINQISEKMVKGKHPAAASEYDKLMARLKGDTITSSADAQGVQNGYNKSQINALKVFASPVWAKATDAERLNIAKELESQIANDALTASIKQKNKATVDAAKAAADELKHYDAITLAANDRISVLNAEAAANHRLTQSERELAVYQERIKNGKTGLVGDQVAAHEAQLKANVDAQALAAGNAEKRRSDAAAQKQVAANFKDVFSQVFAPNSDVMQVAGHNFGTALKTSLTDSFSSAIFTKPLASFTNGLSSSLTKAMSGNFKGMTSADKGSLYLAVAATAVGYLGSKDTQVTAAQRQSLQGSGSVLGDYNAKSASIAKGIEVIAAASMASTPVTESMAASLKSVDKNMSDFLTVAVKSMGGSFSGNMGITPGVMSNPALRDTGIVAGATSGAAIGSYFGPWGTVIGGALGALGGATSKTDRAISDKGLQINGTLGDFRQGGGSINQYVSGVDNSSSMFGLYSSSAPWRKQQAVGGDVNGAFANIFTGIATTFKTAATAMGKDSTTFDAQMNKMSVNIGDLSLMNLSVPDQQTAIMNAISKTTDAMALQLFPQMQQFNVAGEGMAQTAIRVVAQNEAVTTALNHMGGAQRVVSSGTFKLTDELTRAAGGLDKLLPAMAQFTKFYTTSSQQLSNSYAKSKFSGTVLSALVNDKTTATQMANYVRAAFASGITPESKMQILDASNSFSAFLTSMQTGIDKLRQSYDSVISSRDGLVSSVKSIQQFNAGLADFRRSVAVDMAAQTNPLAGYQSAKLVFSDIAAKAAAGDTVAQNRLQGAGQNLLAESKATASYSQYQADMASVLNATSNTISYNDSMIQNGMDMLSALDTLNNISDVVRQNTWATNLTTIDLAKNVAGYAAATNQFALDSASASDAANNSLTDYIGRTDANMKALISAIQKPVSVSVAVTGGSGSTQASVAVDAVVANQPAPPVTTILPTKAAPVVLPPPPPPPALPTAPVYGPDNPDPVHVKAKADALLALTNLGATFAARMNTGGRSLQELISANQNGTLSKGLRRQIAPYLFEYTNKQAVYNALPSFDVGTNARQITRNTVAQVHANEEIKPAAFVDLDKSAREQTNNLLSRLLASNESLTGQVAALKDAQDKSSGKLVTAAEKTASLLNEVTAGGNAMAVQIV